MIRRWSIPVLLAVIALLVVDAFFHDGDFTQGAYARMAAAADRLVTFIGDVVEIRPGNGAS
jgi:hypothetical protein